MDNLETIHWTLLPNPVMSEEINEVMKSVKNAFPHAILFHDIHCYVNNKLNIIIYCICEPLTKLESENVMIEGDYLKDRNQVRCIGEWCDSPEGSWENAWKQIQQTMLERLQK